MTKTFLSLLLDSMAHINPAAPAPIMITSKNNFKFYKFNDYHKSVFYGFSIEICFKHNKSEVISLSKLYGERDVYGLEGVGLRIS